MVSFTAPNGYGQDNCSNACLVGFESRTVTTDSCNVTPTRRAEFPQDWKYGGSCDTDFLIDAEGKPFDIHASCTDRVFELSALRFASGLRYDLHDGFGNACFSEGVRKTYPIAYVIEDDDLE
jgi:hypothetical protein